MKAVRAGDLHAADEHMKAVRRLASGDAGLEQAYAMLLVEHGRMADAIQAMRHAANTHNNDPAVLHRYASLLAHAGEHATAVNVFDQALTLAPSLADGWYLRGLALIRLGRIPEARSSLHKALGFSPGHPRYLRALADLEFDHGFPADALPLWRQLANAASAGDTTALLRLGETLSRLGEEQAARDVYSDGVAAHTDAADLWMALAQAEEDLGQRTSAKIAYTRSLQLRPGWAFPLAGLLCLERGQADHALIEQADAQVHHPATNDPDRALLAYELGKVLDARGEYVHAMETWHLANAARGRMAGTAVADEMDSRIKRMISTYTRERVDALSVHGNKDARPVFIVGMPRSGTTLTEQIIASHSSAHGCGELPDIILLERELGPMLAGWTDASPALHGAIAKAAQRYLTAATRQAPSSSLRLLDKAPLNFFNLGLIAILFPNARVIWCRRDPRDIAVSIYGENFAVEERLASSLQGIGHYINGQVRLMRHWQSVLSLSIVESSYETLALDLDTGARRLVAAAELPWEPGCLEFHLNTRGVQTPSRWQVRQPIHARSIGRWKHYRQQLDPLLAVLSAESYA